MIFIDNWRLSTVVEIPYFRDISTVLSDIALRVSCPTGGCTSFREMSFVPEASTQGLHLVAGWTWHRRQLESSHG